MGKVLVLTFVLICLSGFTSVLADDDWWEYGHFYQIYPRSFQDSNGDGVGDLHGITVRLPYLKYIGVTGVWLSPIFQSPMKDFGYDISDFRKIHSEYGTIEDFDRLIERCKELDLKLILDFVPNHSSDKHAWFVASANPTHKDHEKYKDYYVWNEGTLLENGTRVPPSNWLSIFRQSAWTWVNSRKAFYLHQFLEQQPDLNYRNDALVNEMKEIMRFWLRKGVSGFRCDAVPFLFESGLNEAGLYDDEPLSGECQDDPEASCYLKHIKTQDLDETYDMIYQFRNVTEEDEFKDQTRILMTEAYTSFQNTLRFYGKVDENGEIVQNGSQIPFNFELISKTNMDTTSYEYKAHIEHWLNGMPKGGQANWVLGNHDNKRLASRYRPTRTDLFNILLKTLPGITITYMGEEIGMTDVYISWEDTVDPQACRTNAEVFNQFSRDPARTPMQWNGNEKNSGFSFANTTWLPVASNYTDNNVELQKSEIVSHLKVFRQLITIRQNPTMKYGAMKMSAVNKDVLIYKRSIDDDDNNSDADVFIVITNLGPSYRPVTLSYYFRNLPLQMKVVAASIHSEILVIGDIVDTRRKVVIPPEAGIVIIGKNSK